MTHAYSVKLLQVLPDLIAKTKSPGIYHLFTLHDDWCAFLRGGECNCDPDFVLVAAGRKGDAA